jgi:UV DNA damage endonuclease
MNLGYACINTELQSKGIQCSRCMIKRTFLDKGINYCAELAEKNCEDLFEVVKWNNKNNIKLFRITSELFPWCSEYDINSLPNINQIKSILEIVGKEANKENQRLTFHPGPFNVLASHKEDVVNKTIKELQDHALIMDFIGMPQNHWSKINIHIGGAYGEKEETAKNFVKNFQKLNESAKKRLTLENDDKKNLYSVDELYKYIFSECGIPIVYDAHHHAIGSNPNNLSHEEALKLAHSTWADIRPVCHMSSSAQLEGKKCPIQAHSDYILSKFDNCGLDLDLMLEAKQKEQALFDYLKKYE